MIYERLEIAKFLTEECPELLNARNVHQRTPADIAKALRRKRMADILSEILVKPTTITTKQNVQPEYYSIRLAECGDAEKLERKLASSGHLLPNLFKDLRGMSKQLPQNTLLWLKTEYGFSLPQKLQKPVFLPPTITQTELTEKSFLLNGNIPKFYRAIEAGQFDALLTLIRQGKISLTPGMLLYHPPIGLGVKSDNPSTIELLMQQGRLSQVFSPEVWRVEDVYKIPKVLDSLPRKPLENQLGGADKLEGVVRHIVGGRVKDIEELVRDSLAGSFIQMAQDVSREAAAILPTLEAGQEELEQRLHKQLNAVPLPPPIEPVLDANAPPHSHLSLTELRIAAEAYERSCDEHNPQLDYEGLLSLDNLGEAPSRNPSRQHRERLEWENKQLRAKIAELEGKAGKKTGDKPWAAKITRGGNSEAKAGGKTS